MQKMYSVEELKAKLLDEAQRSSAIVAELKLRQVPQAGDVYVFPIETSMAIDWVVIHIHPEDPSFFFVVPTDQMPFLGVADIAVPPSAICGARRVRCGRGVWLLASDFSEGVKCGYLEAEYVTLARSKLSELCTGIFLGSQDAKTDDGDPEYQDWILEVARANAAVKALGDGAAVGAPLSRDELAERRRIEVSLRGKKLIAAEKSLQLAAGTGKERPPAQESQSYVSVRVIHGGRSLSFEAKRPMRHAQLWHGSELLLDVRDWKQGQFLYLDPALIVEDVTQPKFDWSYRTDEPLSWQIEPTNALE